MGKRTYATYADTQNAHIVLINGLQALKKSGKSLRDSGMDINRTT